MKKIVALLSFFISINTLLAQEIFQKEDIIINAGLGFGNTLYTDSGYDTKVPFIFLSGEYGIVDNLITGNNGSIGVGPYFGYHSSEYKHNYGSGTIKNKITDWVIGARGTFHYQFVDKLDTYAGMMLGYHGVKSKVSGAGVNYNYSSAIDDGFTFSGFAGARWYFTDNWAAMAELGYGTSIFNIGATYKF